MKNIIFLISLLFSLKLSAFEPLIDVKNDLTYCKGGSLDLKLDMYLPNIVDHKIKRPAVILIHGGSWITGNSKSMSMMAKNLAGSGFVAISVNYRLASAHNADGKVYHFPAAINDVKCAVRWLRANAEKYSIDPDRIGALGSSAGGHLALLLGFSGKNPYLEGDGGYNEYSSHVSSVFNIFGPYNFDSYPQDSKNKNVLENFLGGKLEDIPKTYQLANPASHLTADDPAVFSIHGTEDVIVPYQQSAELHEMLNILEIENQLILVPGEGHGFRGKEINAKTNVYAVEFFNKTLKP